MVEQCLSLQWGVLPTGDTHTHTHIHGRAHTPTHTHHHTVTHFATVVHVQLHTLHLPDCSAETALFLQSHHRGRHFVAELTMTKIMMLTLWSTQRSVFAPDDVITARSKHTYHTQSAKHEAFNVFVFRRAAWR